MIKNIGDIEKEIEKLLIHKGEDGDQKPSEWGWTIKGSFPIEVMAFYRQKITELLERLKRESRKTMSYKEIFDKLEQAKK